MKSQRIILRHAWRLILQNTEIIICCIRKAYFLNNDAHNTLQHLEVRSVCLVNISKVCRFHRCVVVIEMSWGPYQKCLILHWFHRGIGFLQMEKPFTRSLRAPAPAVIGSHDIWSVGMTRVWHRQGGTIFIPIVSQTHLVIFLSILQTFLRASTQKPVRTANICAMRLRTTREGKRMRDWSCSRPY